MSRYYFNFRNGDELTPDPEGMDLPSLDAAYDRACRAAKEMAAEMVLTQGALDARRFEIADEKGQMVLSIPFRELLEVAGGALSAHQQEIARWDDEGGAARSGDRSRASGCTGNVD